LYDGKKTTEIVPSLGYILGDEGSGSYFGKQLLIDFLYHKSPAATHDLLVNKYGLTKEIVFDNVYKKPNANVYLASFAKLLSETPDSDYVHQLVKKGFTHFVAQHVCCFPYYEQYEVSFVGSLAFYFQHIIAEVLSENKAKQGVFLKSPIEPLFEWHKMKT
jgi:glucosamine kinase